MLAPVVLALALTTTGTQTPSCLQVARPLAAGVLVTGGDFARVPCPAAVDAAFRYDRQLRAARTARDLATGEIVRDLPAFAFADVRPGDRLVVQARAGVVVIERQVVAVQAARAGQRLFVRTPDGAVFAVKLDDVRR